MTKKLSNSVTDSIPTELVFFKAKFNKILDERIELGEELYNKPVHTQAQLKSNKDEYYTWSSYNSEFLKEAFNKENNEYRKSYDDADSFFFGTIGLRNSPIQDLKNLNDKLKHKISVLKKIRAKTETMKTSVLKSGVFKKHEMETNRLQIFIVPGHDVIATDKTTHFIESLGFEAIILEERAFSNQTLLEKTDAFPNAKFGIVLYTQSLKDEVEKELKNENTKLKAQQNKIFEHGFLMGKLGKNNICALINENIEMPNDISGAVYISMDESDLWCYSLAKELKKAGYSINMKKYNCA